MRIFKNAWFRRLARRQKISDKALGEAVARAGKGLIDADLGGNVIKQRIARPGQGKSGGYRTILIFKNRDKAFFVYGFAKSERKNIDQRETDMFKKAAKKLLALSDEQIQSLIENGGLTEVKP
ncbi:MAG: type II toxin-antitoxin system RelE/ParE family toxin [Nitrospinae bacterium]|nr:type II toxin-antitoxin system RelE/ParE family toxin [Nitrospinota bacterium]